MLGGESTTHDTRIPDGWLPFWGAEPCPWMRQGTSPLIAAVGSAVLVGAGGSAVTAVPWIQLEKGCQTSLRSAVSREL